MFLRPSVEANSVELRVESCINWSLEKNLDPDIRLIRNRIQNQVTKARRSQDELSEELTAVWLKVSNR